MSLSVGIVGLPNVGKSSLFRALTAKPVEVANYPFATIDPNVGVVKMPDERLDKLAAFFHSKNIVPAIVEFVDIAGLVKGAHEGEGLGNKFLTHIREVAAIVHVVRCFENPDIIHVENRVNPLEDIDTINTELILKDIETLEKRLETIHKDVRAGKKEAVVQEQALAGLKEYFNQGKFAREYFEQFPESAEILKELQFLTAKPVIFLLNADTEIVSNSLKQKIESQGASYLAMNIKDEMDMAGLSAEEARELGMESKLPLLIKKAYEILNLITFLTTGEDESRAWTIARGTSAPQAAGVIHTDFEEKFIKALVIPWDKLLETGSYAEAASRGWVRTEGREYIVQDGDVIEVKHAA
ncbi:MAG: redox-regulated ATPase YchF [Candidatus Wildermuthbacteria bacterium]|nr:redox-regulated ATPase YchF [Candidatus Wildermuthbacteria bacterium]